MVGARKLMETKLLTRQHGFNEGRVDGVTQSVISHLVETEENL